MLKRWSIGIHRDFKPKALTKSRMFFFSLDERGWENTHTVSMFCCNILRFFSVGIFVCVNVCFSPNPKIFANAPRTATTKKKMEQSKKECPRLKKVSSINFADDDLDTIFSKQLWFKAFERPPHTFSWKLSFLAKNFLLCNNNKITNGKEKMTKRKMRHFSRIFLKKTDEW